MSPTVTKTKVKVMNLYLSRDLGPMGTWALWSERPKLLGNKTQVFDHSDGFISLSPEQANAYFGLKEPSMPVVWKVSIQLDAISFGDMEIPE